MNKTESIVQEASQLTRHERVEIIEKLLETLEPDSDRESFHRQQCMAG